MYIKETAQSMSKQQVISHYHTNYSLSSEEYEEMEGMTITELRNMLIEGESF